MKNYESSYWALIYDQMMEGECADWLRANRRFYSAQLEGVSGPVLDCACGTGLFSLPWLEAGHDVYGFDASTPMLDALRRKAGKTNLAGRLSCQKLQSFHYDFKFEAACVPTNTFGMLTTQADQLQTLRNIHRHLQPGGRLLLDLNLPGIADLAAEQDGIDGRVHEWVHPDTGRTIYQQIIDRRDHAEQVIMSTCRITYDEELVEFPMWGRWIWRAEFELLLRSAGFARWAVYGSPEATPLTNYGLTDQASYWVAWRD